MASPKYGSANPPVLEEINSIKLQPTFSKPESNRPLGNSRSACNTGTMEQAAACKAKQKAILDRAISVKP